MNKLLRISVWIHLILSVYIILPKEFFHSLHECHETTDHHDVDGLEQVSELHHHCQLLQLDSPPVAMFCEVHEQFNHEAVLTYYQQPYSNYTFPGIAFFQLRGPPQMI